MASLHRYQSSLACAAAMLALSACGDDSTGPALSTDVLVSLVAVHGPTLATDTDGSPAISCMINLRATARGPGGAEWQSAVFRWYVGSDRRTPVDSAVIQARDVRDSWGGDDISAGGTQHAQWGITGGIPFSAALEFRYRPAGGSSRSATVTFTCGPDIPAGTPPPSITSVAVRPPAKEPEPGDTLVMEYSASSTAGLWLTVVGASGPCNVEGQVFFDSLRTTVTRTVRIPLPIGCALGRPITITVHAVDGAGQETTRSVATQISLVDRTAPTMSASAPSGDYFVGDSIPVQLFASDNHALQALIWDVLPAGRRDSVRLSSIAAMHNFFIPLGPDAVGSIQLRVYARDSVGNISNVVLSDEDAIRVYPTVTRPTRSATITGDIRDVAFDVPRGIIYLLLPEQRRLTVISSATLDVIRSVELPSQPADFDLSAGGDSLIIVLPLERALAIYDLRTPSVPPSVLPLVSVDTPTVQRPLNVRVASNGKAFVAFREVYSRVQSILEVDLATGQQRPRPEARGTNVESDAQFTRSPDASVLMLGNGPWFFQRYDAATDTFGPQQQPRRSGWLSMSTGGATLAVGADVYDASMRFVRTVSGGGAQSVISVDGQFLYSPHWSIGIVRSRASDGRVLDRTPNPIRANLIRVSPDGAMIVSVERQIVGTSKISTIDLR